jgi:hypothetical protein
VDRNKFIDDLITAGAKDDEILESLKLAESKGEFGSSQPQEQKDPSFVGAIPSDLNKAGGELADIWTKPQSLPSKAWQTLGLAGKTAGTVAGRIAEPVVETGLDVLTQTTPDERKKAISGVINSAPVQNFAKTYNTFKQDNPELAGNIEGGLGIVQGMTLGKLGGTKLATDAASAIPDAIGNAAKSAGEGMKDFSKLGQGKSWKLTGKPDEVLAKRNVAAKNDIWGNARDGAEKTNDLISQKYNDLKASINDASGLPSTQVNPGELFSKAESAALKNSDPVKEDAIVSAFQKIKARVAKDYAGIDPKTATPEEVDLALNGTKIDLADAQMLKQQIGEWGDDVFDVTKKGKRVTAQSGDHQAYINAYDQFKTAIEDLGPPGIKEKNKELSTLLGLRRDLRNRTAVQERNNFMPLDEVISATGAALSLGHGNPLPAAIYGAQVASKSPSVLRSVYKLGDKISPKLSDVPSPAIETPLNVDLPNNVNTPTYFRKGVNPEQLNETFKAKAFADDAQKAENAAAIPNAIQKLKPKYSPPQDMLDAMRRFQTGKQPDFPIATIEKEGTPTALQRLSSQIGVKYKGIQDGGKLGDLYNFTDPKTGSDFYTRSTNVQDILSALNNMRKKWEPQ